MPRFVIKGASGFPLKFAATQLFGGQFVIVGESQAENSALEIVQCLCAAFPEFRYGVSPILWVTRSEDSVTGQRLLRQAFFNDEPDPVWVDWGNPCSWEHQHQYVQDAVLACEALLADSNVPGELD